MNKKTLPILILILIVIVCVAILVQNLAAPTTPVQTPAQNTTSTTYSVETPSTASSSLPQGQNQPAGAATPSATSTDKLKVITIEAPAGSISVEVASTSEEQAKGLGQRLSLPDNQGMLFPFMYPGDYGFWMKDMHFPLDMVWISSDKKVVSITPNISPDTYPTVFYPPLAISYVLELNAGAAKEFGIATDTELVFSEKYTSVLK